MWLDTKERERRERKHICSLRELKEGKREARLCEVVPS